MRARKVYALLACFIVIVGLIVAAFVASKRDARHAIDENNRKLCELLAAQDQPDVPATTVRGEKIARAVANLRRAYRCP